MRHIAGRRTAAVVAALAVTTMVAAGCSDDSNDDSADSSASTSVSSADGADSSASADSGDSTAASDVELEAADGTKVTLTGPIAAKYSAATDEQKKSLGKPLTGDEGAGKSESGVVFQQFDGGVITAKNDDASTPAYITWGKIRDAWNVKRDDDGKPAADGKSGSNGPLGAATSDETTEGTVKKSTFENGEITWDSSTNKVAVTVKGKTVAAK